MKKKDLRSLKQNPQIAKQMEDMDPASVQQVHRMVEQYQGKSEGELYEELRKKMHDGNVNTGRVNELAQKLVPLLNADQQQRLRTIINDLKREK